MVSSIRGFAQELGSTHVVKSHVEKQRTHTLRRTATTDLEYENLKAHALAKQHHKISIPISEPFDITKRTVNFDVEKAIAQAPHESRQKSSKISAVTASLRVLRRVRSRPPKILLMRQEKDRFDAMRKIQHNTHKFKRYSALTMSFIACKSGRIPLLSPKLASIFVGFTSCPPEGLSSCSWTPLVRRRCRVLGSRIEVPRSELFPSSLLLLRLPSHYRLWRSESQKQCRKTIVYRLVPYRRPNHDDPYFGHGRHSHR